MTSLETEVKTKSEHNVCDDVTVKEKCNIQHRTERYLLIVILDSVLFWVMSFL